MFVPVLVLVFAVILALGLWLYAKSKVKKDNHQ